MHDYKNMRYTEPVPIEVKLVSEGKTIDAEIRERIYKIADLTKQRDELLAALKEIAGVNWHFSMSQKIAREAIAKVESEK